MKKRTLWTRLACMVLLLALLTGCGEEATPRPTAEEYVVGKWVRIGSYTVTSTNEPESGPYLYVSTVDGTATSSNTDDYFIFYEDNTFVSGSDMFPSEGFWITGNPETGAFYWSEGGSEGGEQDKQYLYTLSGAYLYEIMCEGLMGIGGVEYFKSISHINYKIIKKCSFLTIISSYSDSIKYYYYMKVEE